MASSTTTSKAWSGSAALHVNMASVQTRLIGLFFGLIVMMTYFKNGNSFGIVDRREAIILQSLQLLQGIDTVSSTDSGSLSSKTLVSSTDNGVLAVSPTTSRNSSPQKQPEITDKVFMDIRVSRQDGSFYVRDDLPDTFENRVLQARLVFGLYGTVAPNTVQNFLRYFQDTNQVLDDDPLPSYRRAMFTSFDQSTGVLLGGYIPSLQVTTVGGSNALQYGKRILPAPLWIERSSPSTPKLSHSSKGLLTHRSLDVTPVFGITTRPCESLLDGTNTVFGEVIWNDETANFFSLLQDLPTYSIDRPKFDEDPTTSVVASSIFNAQREFFRGAAKSFGDTRVDKVYEGKLLRRMEVTQVGRI